MSNCYDHEYKSNMLDSYYWDNKEQAKENVLKNYQDLKKWYEKECKKYINALGSFDNWYTEYTGGSWEENNIDEYKGGQMSNNIKPEVTITWGTEKEITKTYIFEDETQKAFFLKGVDESNGWLEYEIVEKGETISYVQSNNPVSRIIPQSIELQ